MIFGTNLCTLNIGLMKCGRVQWQEAEETRQYFKNVLIHQDKKFLLPSSSRSFRTQIHWSWTAGQCTLLIANNSSSTFITLDVQSVYIMNKGLISGGQNIEQKTDGISSRLWILLNKEQRVPKKWPGSTASCMVPSDSVEETSKQSVLGGRQIGPQNQLADILTKGEVHTWWVESLVDFVLTWAISVLQLALLQWQERAQQESVEGTSHSKIKTYDEFNSEDAFGRVVFNFIKPGEDLVWISRSWRICCGRRSIRWNLKDRHQQVIQKRITVDLGLLKSGYVELRRTIDRGNLRKLLGMRCNKFAPPHEEPLLDGNAQSVRYGEIIHDGSEKPDQVNSQEVADSETFVMGSDAAEFVNKVKRPSAKQTGKGCRTLQNQEKSIQ